jgi:DNA-binding NtrC family response regulator
MPTIRLNEDAVRLLLQYRWGGNIRQLRNVAEQISVLEQNRDISYETLKHYLPDVGSNLPAVINSKKAQSDFSSEREILYKVLFDMQRDVNDLKKLTLELMKTGNAAKVQEEQSSLINKIYSKEKNHEQDLASIVEEDEQETQDVEVVSIPNSPSEVKKGNYDFAEEIEEEENLSLQEKELELIKKSLEKYNGKRKDAADELGISERTLYRKIKQYNL